MGIQNSGSIEGTCVLVGGLYVAGIKYYQANSSFESNPVALEIVGNTCNGLGAAQGYNSTVSGHLCTAADYLRIDNNTNYYGYAQPRKLG